MQILRFDDVAIDVDAMLVTKAGAPVDLEPKSFHLLTYLARNGGRVVKKEEILEQVWNGTAVTDNALTRAVAQLRKALGDDARQPRYIETVPTVGYRFLPPLESSASPPEATPAPPQPERVSWLRRMLVPVGALFAVLVGYMHRNQPTEAPIPALRSVQITSSPGLDCHPSFSPDGSSLAYASDRSGSFEIYIKLAGSEGSDVQVTSDGRQNVEPAWSPDGKLLVYHSMKERGLFVIPSLGGAPRRISDFGSQPSWSPESRRIVFRSAPAVSMAQQELAPAVASTLWTVPAYGGEPTVLTQPNQPPGRHSDAVFAPDGRRVLFVSFQRSNAELWEIELQSRKLSRLDPGVKFAYSPHFTPDGSGIFYFGVDAADAVGLYAMGIDKDSRTIVRKPERLLTFDFVTPRGLAIGKDTRRLAYAVTTSSSNLWLAASGSDRQLTADTSRRLTVPVFSPDGRKLAYAQRRKGAAADIWTSDADGKKAVQITTNASQDFLPSWTPDGRAVLFDSLRNGQRGLWSYSLSDGREKEVLRFAEPGSLGRLSPNGREVVFHRGPDDELGVWKVDLATKGETRLTPEKVPAGYPAWSPDGKRVAVESWEDGNSHLGIVAAEGGEIRKVTSRPGQAWPWSWSPDGKQIAISGHWDGLWNVYSIDAGSGEAKALTQNTLARVFVRYPAWSPKGQGIVYEKNETKGNLFVAAPSLPEEGKMKPF